MDNIRIGRTSTRGRGRDLALVLIVATCVGAGYLPKPVHIDDALYLAVARQIMLHPLDPYGGILHWQDQPEPTWKSSISPPLVSYYLALIMSIAGENIPVLHAAMIPWYWLLGFSAYSIARRETYSPAMVAIALLCSPAVAVGGNLMLDVPMTASLCASVALALRGERARSMDQVAPIDVATNPRDAIDTGASVWLHAGLWAAVACLCKYPAVGVLPLLALIAVRSRQPKSALMLLLPVAAVLGWQAWSRSLYGASQVGQSWSFLDRFRLDFVTLITGRMLSCLATLAMTFPLWLTLPFTRVRPIVTIVSLLAGVGGVALSLSLYTRAGVASSTFMVFATAVFLGCWSFTRILLFALLSESPDRPRRRWLWLTWIIGVGGIVIGGSPFIAARSLLPMQLPYALLVPLPEVGRARRAWYLVMAANALLSIGLGVADYQWASCYPRFVEDAAPEFKNNPVTFNGHWGWQYYAERAGWKPWVTRDQLVPNGMVVMLVREADPRPFFPVRSQIFAILKQVEPPASWPYLTTAERFGRVRFYGGDFGTIPWWFSTDSREVFAAVRTE